MDRNLIKYFILLLSFTASKQLLAQQTMQQDTVTLGQIIEYHSAKRYNYLKTDSATYISLAGDVKLKQGKTFFDCDSAVLNQQQNIVEAFGHVHINDADSVHTYADYMKYLGKEKKAYLRKNVRLTDAKGTLTTSEMEYETTTKIGTYYKSGKIVTGKAVLTSTEGTYYGDTRDVYFKKNVVLIDPEYKIYTDTLLYNMETEVARFVTYTKIISETRTVTTTEGYYDKKNKKAVFSKRSLVSDKDYDLTADKMAFDDASGFGQAQGKAIYKTKDTRNRTTVMADDIKFNRKANSFLATMKPMMILEQKTDSLFIAADTLYSAKLSDARKFRDIPVIRDSDYLKAVAPIQAKDTGSNRFFEAYYNVRIYSDSMQAVGDSLFYSLEDSTFRLFKDPVVWFNENQITGDTIYLFTRNKKPERLYVFENAMTISHVSNEYFNQVRGNTINGYFKNGEMDYLRSKGMAQSVYYAIDDNNAYIGVNTSTADIIDMYFLNKKPQRVVFRNDLVGTTYPMKQVNHTEIRLKGFKWLDLRRPKSWQELLK
jgi:lipopolysaccharide export system protein LptA